GRVVHVTSQALERPRTPPLAAVGLGSRGQEPSAGGGGVSPSSRLEARGRLLELRLLAVAANPGVRPVGNLLLALGDVLAPRFGADGAFGLPNEVEMAVGADLSDVDGLVEVVILLV